MLGRIKLEFDSIAQIKEVAQTLQEAIKVFLKEHTSNVNKSFFVKAAGKLWPAADAAALSEDSFDGPDSSIHSNRIYRGFSNRVFAVFAIYIVAIDLIVSNIFCLH